MNNLATYSACILLSLASSITIAAPGDDLDEVTIGVLNDDNINNEINEIEIPNIGDHEGDIDDGPGKEDDGEDGGDSENDADSEDEADSEDSADDEDSDAEDDREDDQTEANEDQGDSVDSDKTGTP